MIKAVWRERWNEVRTLREELEAHEVDVPVVIERTERRESMVKEVKTALESFKRATHGKVRTNNVLKAGGSKASGDEARDQRSNGTPCERNDWNGVDGAM